MGSSASTKQKTNVRATAAPTGKVPQQTQMTVVQASPVQQQQQQYQPPPHQVYHQQPQQYNQPQYHQQHYQQPVQYYQQPQYSGYNQQQPQQQPMYYSQPQGHYQQQHQHHQQAQYQQHHYQQAHVPEQQRHALTPQRQDTPQGQATPQGQETPQRHSTPKGNVAAGAVVSSRTPSITGSTEIKTPKEVLEHNRLVRKNHQHNDYWVILEKKIYLASITENLFNAYRQEMKDILSVEPEEETSKQHYLRLDELETLEHSAGWMRFGQTIFQALQHFKFDKADIMNQALPFYVGDLKVYSKNELRDEFKVEILELSTELSIERTDEYWVNEYQKCLNRRLKTIGTVDDVSIPTGDPNQSTFNLPDGVDPKEIREWSESWELFETLQEGGLFCNYDYPVEKDDRDQHQLFAEALRTWYNDWELFDLSIDGEAAWDVIPAAVIAEDIVTTNQLEVIESRKKRQHFGDPKRMAARRERLAEYFKAAYANDRPYVTLKLDHVGWAARLEENWQKLQDLS